MDKKIIAIIAVLLTSTVLLGAFLLKVPVTVTVKETVNNIKETLGAVPGSEFTEGIFNTVFRNLRGQRIIATSTVSTATLLGSDVCENVTASVDFETATGTVTFPTGLALNGTGCFKNIGDTKTITLYNTQAATSEFRLANAASSTLARQVLASSTESFLKLGTSTVPGAGFVTLTVRKISSSTDWFIWTANIYE